MLAPPPTDLSAHLEGLYAFGLSGVNVFRRFLPSF